MTEERKKEQTKTKKDEKIKEAMPEKVASHTEKKEKADSLQKKDTKGATKAPQKKTSPKKSPKSKAAKSQDTTQAATGKAVKPAPVKAAAAKAKSRKMLVSILPGEQVEVALVQDGRIEEYYVEMLHQNKTRGNIYKGKINNIDKSLEAAFVNYGEDRNGFLQVDEVHPEYYQTEYPRKKGERYPPLHKVLKSGQEVLVQVVKEPVGKKGAFLTTYLSLPGRYFVLTPGNEQLGISRKIEDEKERQRLKDIVQELKLDEGHGVIVRTVSEARSKTSLSRDLQFLKRLWKDIRKKGLDAPTPSLLYEEKDLAFRAVRDYLSSDVTEIWVDHEEAAEQMREFVSLVFPRRKNMVRVHKDQDHSLFARFSLEEQLEAVFSREVKLPSGGRLVFDPTEALTAVDINSGKTSGEKNFRELALKTNLEAAREVVHQLMLRDIGGQIVIDFIEMKDPKHVREVEKTIRAEIKADKARTDVGRISRFGLQQLVRQRLGISALSTSLEACPYCSGSGIRRNREWQAMRALKEIYRQLLSRNGPGELVYITDAALALYLLNHKRHVLARFEQEFGQDIRILIRDEQAAGH